MTPVELWDLAAALPRGKAHATNMAALARAFGYTDDRPIREGIEQLITEGLEPQAKDPKRVPVVTGSTANSVYVAVTPAELELAIGSIKGRTLALLRRQRGLRLCREPLVFQSTGTLF